MNSSELISGHSLIVFGLAVVIFVFLMRRTFLQGRKRGDRKQSLPGNADAPGLESSAEAAVEKLEVRIFDFAREVEARMQTRISVLDRLIVDADREILRLQDLLAATKEIGSPRSLSGPLADPRSTESPTGSRSSGRQPDVVVPPSAPAAGQRDAA